MVLKGGESGGCGKSCDCSCGCGKNTKTGRFFAMANISHLVYILDRSGSMGGLEGDTIGGFNSMLKEQQKLDGEATVTTVLFDDKYELLHDMLDVKSVKPITEKEYSVRGSTALLDAIGRTIQRVRSSDQYGKDDRALFTIITDGMENASREFSAAKIKKMIERQKSEWAWEFVFIGANIDSVAEAGKIGIGADMAVNYAADSAGVAETWAVNIATSTSFRAGNDIRSAIKDIVSGNAPKDEGEK
jgi:uncharacterized protein YegL